MKQQRCVTKRNPYFVIIGSGMVVIDKVISCRYKIPVSPKPPPAVTTSLDPDDISYTAHSVKPTEAF